jgi:hypothetical protein
VCLRALSGKQVHEHRLADQFMAEHITVGVADQNAGRDGRAQGSGQRGVIRAGHRGQQGVTDPRPAHGRYAHHLLSLLRQVLDRSEQQIAQ